MKTRSLIQNSLLPLESVKLGRLVLNARNPLQDFFDPSEKLPEPTIKPQEKFQETLSFSKNSKLRYRLTALLSVSYENRDTKSVTLVATKATTYQLPNSGAWFRDACAKQETRKWFESAIEDDRNVYLVIGYYTLTDAQAIQGGNSSVGTGGGVQLSGASLSGGAPPTPVGDILDSRVDGMRDTYSQYARSFYAPGEQIYAIQYRKVEFKWLSSRSLEKPTLERNNRWKIFWQDGSRGDKNDEFDGEDDVLEADLVDDLDFGSEEQYISEDGTEEFLF